MKTKRFLLVTALLVLGGTALFFVGRGKLGGGYSKDSSVQSNGGLECWTSGLSFTSRPPEVQAELVLRNSGDKPIRVCRLCVELRTQMQDQSVRPLIEVCLRPDTWKSVRPTLEMSAHAVVTLKPGDTTKIPFSIWKADASSREIVVKAGYGVDGSFADELHLWSGCVWAQPVTARLP